jgi:hypothetical protein
MIQITKQLQITVSVASKFGGAVPISPLCDLPKQPVRFFGLDGRQIRKCLWHTKSSCVCGKALFMASVNGQTTNGHDLEAQADAILRRDEELLAQLGLHVEALQRCYAELLRPRNDPEYIKRLEKTETQRNDLANLIDKVHLVQEHGKYWLSASLTNPRSRAKAIEALRLAGDHFEAEIIRHEDPKDKSTEPAINPKQEPKHRFGRTKRSLPE